MTYSVHLMGARSHPFELPSKEASKNIYNVSKTKDYADNLAKDISTNTDFIGNYYRPTSTPFNIVEDQFSIRPEGKEVRDLGLLRGLWRLAVGTSASLSKNYITNWHVVLVGLGVDLIFDTLNLNVLNNEINEVKLLSDGETADTSQKASLYANKALQNIQRQTTEYTALKATSFIATLLTYLVSPNICREYVVPADLALLLAGITLYIYRDFQNLKMAKSYLKPSTHEF